MYSLRKQRIALFGFVTLFFNVVGLSCIPSSLIHAVSAQAPIVSVKSQPDAPILLRLESIVSDNPYAPAFEYSVVNVSDRLIKTYAIRLDDEWGVTIFYSPLKPQESRRGTYGDVTSAKPTKGITVVVDYVEFKDGTTWGPDIADSADRLAGMRAGRSAERDHLLKLLEEGGATTVTKVIDTGNSMAALPANHSIKWELGFRSGMRNFLIHILDVYREKGLPAMEDELRKSLEASEETWPHGTK